MSEWQTVIGLEIHVQLNTYTKLFSPAPVSFGNKPNENAYIIDLGYPGTLPVLNASAVDMALLFGLSINAQIPSSTYFARKNYFYPDLPKGYQTSQQDDPVVGEGIIEIKDENNQPKKIRILRAHLEEDAGKSIHDVYDDYSAIDLNRAGTPLIEIVSYPDLSSAKEAVNYLKFIHSLVVYLGICDGNMSQGSFRCDANVSVKKRSDEQLGTRTETKNVNSFKFVESAINYEINRQINLIESGGKVVQETLLYDPIQNVTKSMRDKEDAHDYRYFPCPDLLKVKITQEMIDKAKAKLPELPIQKQQRFIKDFGLSVYDAEVLVSNKDVADYFEAVLKISDNPKVTANWIITELFGVLQKNSIEFNANPIDSDNLGILIKRINEGKISGKIAKEIFAQLFETQEQTVDEIIEKKGLSQISDVSLLAEIINDIKSKNPEQVLAFKEAVDDKKSRMIGFFVGQVMKVTQGKANPKEVNQLLNKILNE